MVVAGSDGFRTSCTHKYGLFPNTKQKEAEEKARKEKAAEEVAFKRKQEEEARIKALKELEEARLKVCFGMQALGCGS